MFVWPQPILSLRLLLCCCYLSGEFLRYRNAIQGLARKGIVVGGVVPANIQAEVPFWFHAVDGVVGLFSGLSAPASQQ
jgi:hypothetical protein